MRGGHAASVLAGLRAPAPPGPAPRLRALAGVLAVQGALALGLALPAGGAGAAATAAFLVGAPAAAVWVLLRALEPLARVVVTAATAVVVDALVAQFMLVTGSWSVTGGLWAVGLISVALAAGVGVDPLASGAPPEGVR